MFGRILVTLTLALALNEAKARNTRPKASRPRPNNPGFTQRLILSVSKPALANGYRLKSTPSNLMCLPEILISEYATSCPTYKARGRCSCIFHADIWSRIFRSSIFSATVLPPGRFAPTTFLLLKVLHTGRFAHSLDVSLP